MNLEKLKYHICLSNYFSSRPHFFDGDQQKKPHIRKCVELPFQQTKAELWTEVTKTLCNLDFIQAKAVAKKTYDLVNDFKVALEVIPDNIENIRQEKARQKQIAKYIHDLISCAKGEITRFELEIPESITPWLQVKNDAEIERIKTNPMPLDFLRDFLNFLGQEAENLQKYASEFPGFVTQQAWNFVVSGPVGMSAEQGLFEKFRFLLPLAYFARPPWNPVPRIFLTLRRHTGGIQAVSITPDGTRAISCSSDKTCILWNLITGEPLLIINYYAETVAIAPDGTSALIGQYSGECILLNLETGEILKTFRGHNDPVSSLSISPDSKLAISGSADKTCILWDLENGIELIKLKGHTDGVSSVCLTPDCKMAFSGSFDKTCILWDLETGNILETLKGHTQVVNSVYIAPDGKNAISGSDDKSCIIWNLKTGQAIKRLEGHTKRINSTCMTPDGTKAVSVSEDGPIILWDIETGSIICSLSGHIKGVNSLSITPDGKWMLSGSWDQTCILWDLEKGTSFKALPKHSYWVSSVSATPDGRKAISGSYDGTCIVWDLQTGAKILTLKGHKGNVNALSVSPDGKWVISGSDDRTCMMWNLETGDILLTLIGHTGNVSAVAISPDGKWVLSGDWDKTCILWDLKTGQIVQKTKFLSRIYSVLFTPDGKTAVIGYGDTFEIWNLKKARLVRSCHKLNHLIQTISITPDGKKAITGSYDNTLVLWDLRTGKELHVFKGHTFGIESVVVLPDGKKIISASADMTCSLWEIETGNRLACFITVSRIFSVVFSQNSIFLGCESGEVMILKLNEKILCSDPLIVTIRQIWDVDHHRHLPLAIYCPLCGSHFSPSATVLKTIDEITKKSIFSHDQSPCLELIEEAWNEPGLIDQCPFCMQTLKYNPFIAGRSLSDIEIAQLKNEEMLDEAESAFTDGQWEKAGNLYRKMIQQGMFEEPELRFKMLLCLINSLDDNNPEKVRRIQSNINLLIEKKEDDKVKIIYEKLKYQFKLINTRKLLEHKKGKPWWKKLF